MKAFLSEPGIRCSLYNHNSTSYLAIDEAKRILAETEPEDEGMHVETHSLLAEALAAFVAN